MTNEASLAPVALSYVAALRGLTPRPRGKAFAYALAHVRAPELLIGLAASNPEGSFYGLVPDPAVLNQAMLQSAERGVGNVTFLSDRAALPKLDYLACDESQNGLTHVDRAALFDLAAAQLKAGGLFAYTYRAYTDPTDALRFLVREFAPEMNAEQAVDFLLEIKKLGHLYFPTHADLAAKLDQAIAKNLPDDFFALFDEGDARSASFDTMVAMRTRGLSFAGAGHIASNYIELSIPPEAQGIVIECRDNPLYEPLKDFSSLRSVRTDIWSKQPAEQSSDPAILFGGFVYGITAPENKVPEQVDVFGKTVDLSSPLYRTLIALMATQPVGIGDILQSEEGKNLKAAEIVSAVHILIALGIARPMRGAEDAGAIGNLAQPRFSGSFNRYISTQEVAGQSCPMASRVLGDVISVSPRDALVMQALNRAGLANSVSALLPELERLAKDPAASARITDVAEPTAESAHQMINDAVSQSMVQWYAYGLLEAA